MPPLVRRGGGFVRSLKALSAIGTLISFSGVERKMVEGCFCCDCFDQSAARARGLTEVTVRVPRKLRKVEIACHCIFLRGVSF